MNQPPVPLWKTLLERKTAEHYRRFHPATPTFTRRGFLSTATAATGLLAASQFALSPLAVANEGKTTAEPNPIPGGGTAFGFHVHHNPLPNDPTLPLTIFNTAQGDPSEIGDFNGLVLDTMIRVGHPGATDAVIELIKKHSRPPHWYPGVSYGVSYWGRIGRLFAGLPRAEALPKLEALMPTLPEEMSDLLLAYVTELKQGTPTATST